MTDTGLGFAAGVDQPTSTTVAGGAICQISSGRRLVFIDVYRGFVMMCLISRGFGLGPLVGHPQIGWLAAQMNHGIWDDVTFWDLIQPAFTFIAGFSMSHALERRTRQGESGWQIRRHALWRSVALILLGNILSNFNPGQVRPVVQFTSVLCQLGLCYLLCVVLLQCEVRWQIVMAMVILGAQWSLYLLFSGADGPFSRTDNVGVIIDNAVFGTNAAGYPVTINFLGNSVTIMFGAWAEVLLRKCHSGVEYLKRLAVLAIGCICAGLAIEPVNPMIKRLWTASFTLFSTGCVVVMLLSCFWLIEVRRHKTVAIPMIVLGTNSLFIYSLSELLRTWLYQGLGVFTGYFWFVGECGVIVQSMLCTLVMWCGCYWLYRHKIYLKL